MTTTTTPTAARTAAVLDEKRLSSDDKTEVGSNIVDLSAGAKLEAETNANVEQRAGSTAGDSVSGVDQANIGQPEYPSTAKVALVISSLCLAIFLVALDQTIIAPALGAITAQFQSVKDIVSYVLESLQQRNPLTGLRVGMAPRTCSPPQLSSPCTELSTSTSM